MRITSISVWFPQVIDVDNPFPIAVRELAVDEIGW